MPQMKGVLFCNAHETLLWVKKSKEQTGYTFHYRGSEGRERGPANALGLALSDLLGRRAA